MLLHCTVYIENEFKIIKKLTRMVWLVKSKYCKDWKKRGGGKNSQQQQKYFDCFLTSQPGNNLTGTMDISSINP